MRNVIYMYNTFYNKEWKNIEKKREEKEIWDVLNDMAKRDTFYLFF